MYKEIPEMTPEKTGSYALYIRGEHSDEDRELTVTTYDDGTVHDGADWWACAEACDHYHTADERVKTYQNLRPDGRLVLDCWH